MIILQQIGISFVLLIILMDYLVKKIGFRAHAGTIFLIGACACFYDGALSGEVMIGKCIVCGGEFSPYRRPFGEVIDDVCPTCADEQSESRACGESTENQ